MTWFPSIPMSNLSTQKSFDKLDQISIQINRYFSIFIFFFGIIGNLLHCLILSQPKLRTNPCSYYFLMSAIANLISILFGLTTRLLSGWNADFTINNRFLCKLRAFILFFSRTCAFWFIAFATVDRWFSSSKSYQRRQLSSLKHARQSTLIVTILSICLYAQMFYCYDINPTFPLLLCYAKTIQCRLTTDLTYAIITVLCPLILMFIFGLLTILNIRQISTIYSLRLPLLHINKTSTVIFQFNRQQRRRRRLDRQLSRILFIQIIFLTILALPQVIGKLYTTNSIYANTAHLHITIDKFIYNFVLLLTYLANGMPFYICTLCGGRVLRRTLFNLFK